MIGELVRDDSSKTHGYRIFGYDLDGNCNNETNPVSSDLAVTNSNFLAHGLISKRTDALGNSWVFTYDYFYTNNHGQQVCKKTMTDPRGVIQEEIFDARGNAAEELLYSPFGELLSKKELFYDAVGNCTSMLDHSIVNGKASKIIKTFCKYGPNNRLEMIIEAADTPEAKTTSYHYNTLGQKECTIHADGTELYNLYDAKGRVKQFRAKDNSLNYTYSYDASDRILEVTNNLTGQKTVRTYNSLGDLDSETLESGLTLGYSYDSSGRVKNLMLPDATSVAYEYSPVHLKTVTRLDANQERLWEHTIVERDLCGKPVSIQLPHQAGKLSGSHDLLTRTVKFTHTSFSQEVAKFDSVGNLLNQTTRDAVGKVDSTYSYDFLSQMIDEKGFADHSYAYDSLNDRLKLDDKKYEVNSLHSVLSDSDRIFTYDLRGNQKTDGTFIYRYDALDRLTKMEMQDKSYYTYSYDAFDRRIEKVLYTQDGSFLDRIQYLYALQNEIGAVNAEGILIELRILGEGLGAEIGASVGIELKGTLYVPLHDLRGNIVTLLNPQTGNVAESYRYDAFGNETIYDANQNVSQKSRIGNLWRFSSKRVDDETGLVYFGGRYYDPTLGRWLTTDPLGLKAGPNLYAYVLNNPLTKFDLYGLFAQDIKSDELNLPSNDPNDLETKAILENKGFEFRYDNAERIISISLGRETVPGVTTVYINGTNTPLGTALEDLERVSTYTDGFDVELCYNPDYDVIRNLSRCIAETYGQQTRTQRDYEAICRQVLKGKDLSVITIAFSEGAIIARNGLKAMEEDTHLNNQVVVRTVCPGTIIHKAEAKDVLNYVNSSPMDDFVGYLGFVTPFTGKRSYPWSSHVKLLPSHEDAGFFNHEFKSLTYTKDLEKQLHNDIQKYGK